MRGVKIKPAQMIQEMRLQLEQFKSNKLALLPQTTEAVLRQKRQHRLPKEKQRAVVQ